MKESILLKLGELSLKGLNRTTFEDVLVKNTKRALLPLGTFQITRAQSTIYVTATEEAVDLDAVLEKLGKVFGVSALVKALEVEKDFETIKGAAVPYLRPTLERAKTFKVEAKRADKQFPLNSPQICTELGSHLLAAFPHLRVDVHTPDVVVVVEVRDYCAYIHAGQTEGAGGLPVGTSGKAAVLMSGGIDSPVAAYRMAKRGLEIEAIHFAAPPYTSERAKQKVIKLCEKVAEYTGNIKLTIIHFTAIQEKIKATCPEELFTVIMRRKMMEIAQQVARKNGSTALITGESLAQVASQTVHAIACTNAAVTMPVLRPLIGMDKTEIVALARKIDTFATSILPYEDCCTIFTPRHPKTKPMLHVVEEAEKALNIEEDIQQAMATREIIKVKRNREPNL